MLADRSCWVTGATGRLGNSLCARLEELGARPVPLATPGYPLDPKRLPWLARARPIAAVDGAALTALPRPDIVFHLHWQTDRTQSFEVQVAEDVRRNLTALEFLWDYLKRCPPQQIVHASTYQVYGPLNTGETITRTTCPRPASPYGIAKVAAEAFLDANFLPLDIGLVHARISAVSAPGEYPTALMARLYRSAFLGEHMTVNEGHSGHLTYVDEMIDLLVGASTVVSGVYVLAPYAPLNEEVAAAFERVSGRKLNADHRDLAPDAGAFSLVSDDARFRHPFTRAFTLDEMIQCYIAEAAKIVAR